MNIKTTKLKSIANKLLKEHDNIKTNKYLNKIWYINIHKNGNITWSFNFNKEAYKSYYIPRIVEACECRLEKQFIKTLEECILLYLRPLKRSIINLNKKEISKNELKTALKKLYQVLPRD